MKDLILIIITSIRNNLRLKSVGIIYIIVTLMIDAGLVVSFCIFFIAPAMDTASPDRAYLELYLGLLMYCTCILALGINLNSFGFQSMTREKSKGNIESLLATPLKVRDIWVAKGLAIFIPGLVVGEILTLIVLITVNYIYFTPSIGFIFNPWIAVSSFIAAPLIYLCLGLLVQFIGLTGKPATGNIIAAISLQIIVILMINLVIRRILDTASWPFTLANLGIAAAAVIALLSLQSRHTKEKIVLSR